MTNKSMTYFHLIDPPKTNLIAGQELPVEKLKEEEGDIFLPVQSFVWSEEKKSRLMIVYSDFHINTNGTERHYYLSVPQNQGAYHVKHEGSEVRFFRVAAPAPSVPLRSQH